ncbi:gamma-glutamylcyclotransferase family protein [Deinococcus hohokamensis]|uniref:Putative gamma-glutamylcyclotransferase n=1 Tax=Deinococcus hohokamensis TaxID=309883 RepID=A0ABV9IGJ7_9DEIO
MAALPTTVFVYGTLMPGERNADVAAQGGAFVSRPARLRGYRLLHLHPEGYPALVPGDPHEEVRGHALTYGPAVWTSAQPFLDALEGLHETPPLYTREQVQLTLDGGDTQAAWVYLYARAARLQAPGAVHLPGGDWTVQPDRQRPQPGDR